MKENGYDEKGQHEHDLRDEAGRVYLLAQKLSVRAPLEQEDGARELRGEACNVGRDEEGRKNAWGQTEKVRAAC